MARKVRSWQKGVFDSPVKGSGGTAVSRSFRSRSNPSAAPKSAPKARKSAPKRAAPAVRSQTGPTGAGRAQNSMAGRTGPSVMSKAPKQPKAPASEGIIVQQTAWSRKAIKSFKDFGKNFK